MEILAGSHLVVKIGQSAEEIVGKAQIQCIVNRSRARPQDSSGGSQFVDERVQSACQRVK